MKRLSAGFAKKIYSHRDRISTLFLILTLILGSLETYACRYDMNPDSMDYLDIARQIAEGHWNAVANGYWGTLNSILLAPLFLFRLSPALELELAHLQGILILLLAFFSFRFFLHTCIDILYKSAVIDANPFLPLPEWALCVLGYGLFLWS